METGLSARLRGIKLNSCFGNDQCVLAAAMAF